MESPAQLNKTSACLAQNSGLDMELEARYREACEVRKNADCVRTESEVNHAYDQLANAVSVEYADKNPLFLCVMIGGVSLTQELIKRLDFAFELDYLHATRYRGETSGQELLWKASPSTALSGRHVLILDDILDEGHTLVEITQALGAQNPKTLKTLVLAEKIHDRKAQGAHADFIGLQLPDRYVFGCGMDYKEYFRQLPAIYAVSGT